MPVAAFRAMGADVEGALELVNVPSYAVDRAGVVRWTNQAVRRLVGDHSLAELIELDAGVTVQPNVFKAG